MSPRSGFPRDELPGALKLFRSGRPPALPSDASTWQWSPAGLWPLKPNCPRMPRARGTQLRLPQATRVPPWRDDPRQPAFAHTTIVVSSAGGSPFRARLSSGPLRPARGWGGGRRESVPRAGPPCGSPSLHRDEFHRWVSDSARTRDRGSRSEGNDEPGDSQDSLDLATNRAEAPRERVREARRSTRAGAVAALLRHA
jgi:hypothetical protein